MAWQKKMVWIVTIFLKETDENGEPLNWSSSSEEYFADNLEDAEHMKTKFLAGKDEYYGNFVQDCCISDQPEERELWV